MSDCIFCKIIAGEIPADKVYEDKTLLAFLDIRPIKPGHVLVVSKKHYNDLLKTPDDVVAKMITLAKKISRKLIEVGLAEGSNLQINNGKSAGQVANHVHLHIIPRSEYDGLELWHGNEYRPGQAEDVAAKLTF